MATTLEFQFRRRYSLPPTDPRFLAVTWSEIFVDWWAHRITDDPAALGETDIEMDQDDYNAEAARMLAASIQHEEAARRAAAAPLPNDFDDPVIAQEFGGA